MDNRKKLRIELKLPATFCVVIQENTMSPVLESAVLLNLSETGGLVEVEGLCPETTVALLEKPRYCKIGLSHPDLTGVILGRAVWVNRVRSNRRGQHVYRVGLYFEYLKEPMLGALRKFIQARLSHAQVSA